MQIGVETELHSSHHSYYDISEYEGLDFRHFKDVNGLGIKMSEEYYSNTIEYNFTPFEFNKEKMGDVKEYLEEQIKNYSLSLNSKSPSFVGTHIHIFDEDFLDVNKSVLLKRIISFLIDNLDNLEQHSLERLLTGHQLWGYYSFKNNHSWKEKLKEYDCRPTYYDICRDKPKYSPIVSSPERRDGKKASIEIRIIPNEYLFDGRLSKLLEEINSGEIYNRKPKKITDLIEVIAEKLGIKKIEQPLNIESPEFNIGGLAENIRQANGGYVTRGTYHLEPMSVGNEHINLPSDINLRNMSYDELINIRLMNGISFSNLPINNGFIEITSGLPDELKKIIAKQYIKIIQTIAGRRGIRISNNETSFYYECDSYIRTQERANSSDFVFNNYIYGSSAYDTF